MENQEKQISLNELINNLEEKYRRTGRSTRLIDHYIQLLFENKEVLIEDHYNSIDAHINLLERVKRRLSIEHPSLKFKIKHQFIIKITE